MSLNADEPTYQLGAGSSLLIVVRAADIKHREAFTGHAHGVMECIVQDMKMRALITSDDKKDYTQIYRGWTTIGGVRDMLLRRHEPHLFTVVAMLWAQHVDWGLSGFRSTCSGVYGGRIPWNEVACGLLLRPEHVARMGDLPLAVMQMVNVLETIVGSLHVHATIGPFTHHAVALTYSTIHYNGSHLVDEAMAKKAWERRVQWNDYAMPAVPAVGWLTYLPPAIVSALGGAAQVRHSFQAAQAAGLVKAEYPESAALRETGAGGLMVMLDDRPERLVCPPLGVGDYSLATGMGVWLEELLDAKGLRI